MECQYGYELNIVRICKVPVWWLGSKNSPTVTHACRKRRLKWVATLPLGDINTEAWSSGMGVGRGANNPTLKKEHCWEASKKFSRILRRRPRHKLGCGAKERRKEGFVRKLSWPIWGTPPVSPPFTSLWNVAPALSNPHFERLFNGATVMKYTW
jgi:hypothetical protein